MILTSAGTDTTQSDIFANDNTIGVQVSNGANLGTVFNRQFMSSPIAFKAGSRLRFKQIA